MRFKKGKHVRARIEDESRTPAVSEPEPESEADNFKVDGSKQNVRGCEIDEDVGPRI